MIFKNFKKPLLRKFCINTPKLNPHKHLYLGRTSDRYKDYLWFGRIFMFNRKNEMSANLELRNEVIKITFKHLKEKYPKF